MCFVLSSTGTTDLINSIILQHTVTLSSLLETYIAAMRAHSAYGCGLSQAWRQRFISCSTHMRLCSQAQVTLHNLQTTLHLPRAFV